MGVTNHFLTAMILPVPPKISGKGDQKTHELSIRLFFMSKRVGNSMWFFFGIYFSSILTWQWKTTHEWRCTSYSTWWFFIAMLIFRRVSSFLIKNIYAVKHAWNVFWSPNVEKGALKKLLGQKEWLMSWGSFFLPVSQDRECRCDTS